MAKIALLIGVSEYGEGLPGLPGTQADIHAMQRVLENPQVGGFDEVRMLSNPDRTHMEIAIETLFTENRSRNDLIVLYFSGHGVRDDQGTLYFATHITEKNPQGRIRTSTVVPASALQQYMSQSRTKRQVLILDCCFSGAFANDMKAKQVEEAIDIKTQLGGEGRAVLTSSTATQVSYVKEGISIYTRYLIQGLETGAADRDNDGQISVDELHEYAKERVQEEAPSMQPEIYVVREGYKIWLARAPQDDPKLTYRKELDERAKHKRGNLSLIDQRALEIRYQELGLSSQEAESIKAEVLQPYRIFWDKLAQFEQTVKEILDETPQITAESLDDLKYFQRVLKLRDEDIIPVLNRYFPNYVLTPDPTIHELKDLQENQSPIFHSDRLDGLNSESSSSDLENDIEVVEHPEVNPLNTDLSVQKGSQSIEEQPILPIHDHVDENSPRGNETSRSPDPEPNNYMRSTLASGVVRSILFCGVVAVLFGIVFTFRASLKNYLREIQQLEVGEGSPTSPLLYEPAKLISAGDNENLYGSRSSSIELGNPAQYWTQQMQGIAQFREGNYLGSLDTFETIRNDADEEDNSSSNPRRDPELLIFRNNSQARLNHQQDGTPIYTIAAAVPLSDANGEPFDIGQQILFGIALAQERAIVEDKINLEVVIANDRNLPAQAEVLAQELSKPYITGFDGQRREILAVIGHYSSTVTCKALKFYNKAELPIISPASTRTDIRLGCDGEKVFFRTISSSAIEAKSLVNYLVRRSGIDSPKIAAFYKKGEDFSQDIFEQFSQTVQRNLGNRAQITQFDLSNPEEVGQGIQQLNQFNVLAVFPDGRTSDSEAFDKAIDVLSADGGNRLILGANPLDHWDVLNGQRLVNPFDQSNKLSVQPENPGKGLVLAIDWLSGCGSNDDDGGFVEEATDLWGGPPKRIYALSYEAVQVLVDRVNGDRLRQKRTTRETILDDLSDSNYTPPTSYVFDNRTISFKNGDRNEIQSRILVTPQRVDIRQTVETPQADESTTSNSRNELGVVPGEQFCSS